MGRSRDVPRLLLSVTTGLPLLACGGGDDLRSAERVIREDSAGVEIVTVSVDPNTAPVYAVLDTAPELRLGSDTGSREEVFGRIEDVVALRDGGLAVLDGLASDVRFFDSLGQFEGAIGGKGDGPGEFQSPITLLELHGDTIAVFDAVPRRVTRFAPDGALGRVTTLEDTKAFISDAQFLPDGRLVGQSHWIGGRTGQPPREPTLVRDTVVLTSFDEMGRIADTVDIVPSREDVVSIELRPGAVSVRKRPPSFARTNFFVPTAEGLWSSPNDEFELRLRELASGRLLRIVRVRGLEKAALPAVAETLFHDAFAEAETADERNWLTTWFALSSVPEFQPAYDILEADDRGRLWAREWTPSGDGDRWWVLQSDGTLLGSVLVPTGVRITSVSCGSLLGVEQDEFGVDYAVRYSVRTIDEC